LLRTADNTNCSSEKISYENEPFLLKEKNMKFAPKIWLISGIILIMTSLGSPQTATEFQQKASQIHIKTLTLDSHTDTPLRLMRENFDLAEYHDPATTGSRYDIPRMKTGGLDAVFFAAFLSQGPRDSLGHAAAYQRAKDIIQKIKETVSENPDDLAFAAAASDAAAISIAGKKAIYIGIENGYALGANPARVQEFYDMGVRYITLCHTRNNDLCDSSNDKKGPEYDGLSPLGEQVVTEMNRLGMMVDVSHISDAAFYDVLECSKVPVIASHSCARAVCDNPRNMTDDMLKALAAKDGVIQLCLLSSYLKEIPEDPARKAAFDALRQRYNNFQDLDPETEKKAHAEWNALELQYPAQLATVSNAVDHIDHMVAVAGIDHVGIGSDFDGGGVLADCFDVSEMPNITAELLRRGYSETDIGKIWSGNFLRVFTEVEAGRRQQMSSKKEISNERG
jgi:membrane dipeptidase